ncbi:MAG TPA: hypothetical protein VH206_15765 [Xanthobacteraceae bacterium]|jgi:hypothetical protein|nr:hypothetical protein [Xanthobacteraceae bacterium]
MGADRLKKLKDDAKRGWNRAGERLFSPTQLSLFQSDPALANRSFRIMLKSKFAACVGDELLLHRSNDYQFITRGPEVIGECAELPASICDDLKIGGAICVEVISVGTITNTIEVAPK